MAKKSIIIIGGGVGGYVAAIRAAQLGAQPTLIEKDTLGGTCLNRGCIPTKALLESTNLLSLARKAQDFGVHVDNAVIDFTATMKRKEVIVKRLVNGINSLMRKNNVRVLTGSGTITSPKSIKVVETKEELKGDNIIIATGSRPSRVSIPGIDSPDIITSDEALALESLPQTLLVIGGGAVGLEFAHIFSCMGAKVAVVEMMPQILPSEDAEVARGLEQILNEDGIEVLTGSTVTAIGDSGKQKKITIAKGSNREERMCDKVLVAIGRQPNTEGLGLKALGVASEKGRVLVNERMETSVPGVYAVGDVVGRMMLAHVAMEEGKLAAESIMGLGSRLNYRTVPRCVYTSPEVASVGLTEVEARKQYPEIKVGKIPFLASGRALTHNDSRGFVKFVVEAKQGEVLGVHILGTEASELIGEAVIAMHLEATYKDISSCVHAHPTLSEMMMEAALAVDGKTVHL